MMKKPHQEEMLQALYKKSKEQVQQPAQVKQNVLRYAREKRSPLFFLVQWQTVCAVLLVGVLWLQNKETPKPVYSVTADYTETDQKIYYHQVNYQVVEDNSKTDPVTLAEDPEYFAYLASLSKLENTNQLAGVVTRNKGDVVVEVCQLGLVQLSKDLLKQIDNPSVTDQLAIGQNVLLLTDNRGKFVDIQQQTTGYQCAD